MKIKTGDNVKILSGKDRGKTGKVVQVMFDKGTKKTFVVVEGLNVLKKHMKKQRGQAGQVLELPAPMDVSNVMLIDPKTNKSTRVGFKTEGSDKKRIAKKSGEYIS
jgi:large subunit ribosomal protein L24